MTMPVDIESLKKDIFSLLVTRGSPATAKEINDDYKDFFQSDIPFAEFGSSSLDFLLKSHHFFDIIKQVDRDKRGQTRYQAKPAAHSAHIQRLVSGQKKKDDNSHHRSNKNSYLRDRSSPSAAVRSGGPSSSWSSSFRASSHYTVQSTTHLSPARATGSSLPVSSAAIFNSQARPNGFTSANALNSSMFNGVNSTHSHQWSSQSATASKPKVQQSSITPSNPVRPVTGSSASSALNTRVDKPLISLLDSECPVIGPQVTGSGDEGPLISLSDAECCYTDAKLKQMLKSSTLLPLCQERTAAVATVNGTASEPEDNGLSYHDAADSATDTASNGVPTNTQTPLLTHSAFEEELMKEKSMFSLHFLPVQECPLPSNMFWH